MLLPQEMWGGLSERCHLSHVLITAGSHHAAKGKGTESECKGAARYLAFLLWLSCPLTSQRAFPFVFYFLNSQPAFSCSSFCGAEEATVENDEPVKKKKKKKDKGKQAGEEEAGGEEPPSSPPVEVRRAAQRAGPFLGVDSLPNTWSEGREMSLPT